MYNTSTPTSYSSVPTSYPHPTNQGPVGVTECTDKSLDGFTQPTNAGSEIVPQLHHHNQYNSSTHPGYQRQSVTAVNPQTMQSAEEEEYGFSRGQLHYGNGGYSSNDQVVYGPTPGVQSSQVGGYRRGSQNQGTNYNGGLPLNSAYNGEQNGAYNASRTVGGGYGGAVSKVCSYSNIGGGQSSSYNVRQTMPGSNYTMGGQQQNDSYNASQSQLNSYAGMRSGSSQRSYEGVPVTSGGQYQTNADGRQLATNGAAYSNPAVIEKPSSDVSYSTSGTTLLSKHPASHSLNNTSTQAYSIFVAQGADQASNGVGKSDSTMPQSVGVFGQGNGQSYLGGNYLTLGRGGVVYPNQLFNPNQVDGSYRHTVEQYPVRDAQNGEYMSRAAQTAAQPLAYGGQASAGGQGSFYDGNGKMVFSEQAATTCNSSSKTLEKTSNLANGKDTAGGVTLYNSTSRGVPMTGSGLNTGGLNVSSSGSSASVGHPSSSISLTAASTVPKLSVNTTIKSSTSLPSK